MRRSAGFRYRRTRALPRISPSSPAQYGRPKELQAFVQCAYEFVREVGFEEARRAFHEDERWRSGPIYIFFDEVSPVPETSRVFPPDPEMEGLTIAPRETDKITERWDRYRPIEAHLSPRAQG